LTYYAQKGRVKVISEKTFRSWDESHSTHSKLYFRKQFGYEQA
jgi:hypothetical protein